jgi:hypothetical protein
MLLHTLGHTALSRIITAGFDDYTVMALSGHSSTRMLERYTHPTEGRKLGALEMIESVGVATVWPQSGRPMTVQEKEAAETASFLRESGGRQEARTPDLRVANATEPKP